MSDKGRNEIKIVVTTTAEGAKAQFDELRAEGERLGSEKISMPVRASDPIDAAWRAKVNADIRATAKDALKVPLEPDSDEFRAKVAGSLAEASAMARKPIPVDVDVDDWRRQIETALAKARAEVEASKPVQVPTRAENPIDSAWRAQVSAAVKSLSKDALKIPASVDTTGLRTRLAPALAELRDIAKVPVDMEPEDAARLRAAVGVRVAELRADVAAMQPVEVPVDVDTSRAEASAKQGMSTVTKLIIGGVAAGAPAAGGLIAAGLGLGFAGAAILAQKSNKDIVDSTREMGVETNTVIKNATSQVVPYITAATRALSNEVRELGPELGEAFSYAGPDIKMLTQGVEGFARSAMPGMTESMRNSQPVISGTASLLNSLGGTVGDVFGSMSQNAGAYGVAVQSLGPITATAVGGVITLVNGLAQVWAQNAGEIEGVIDKVIGSVDGLAQGALPGLSTELHTALSAGNGLMTVLRPISPLLGTLAADVVPFVASWKAFSGISGLVDRAGQRLEQFGKQASGGMGEAATSVGQFAQKASGAFGAAAGGLVAGLEIYSIATAEQTRQNSQLEQQTQSLTAAFQQSGGAMNGTVNQALTAMDQNVQDTTRGFSLFGMTIGGAAQTIDHDLMSAGISVGVFNSAVAAGGMPLANLRAQLINQAWNGPTSEIRHAAQGILDALPGISSSFNTAKNDAIELSNAAAGIGVSVSTMHAGQAAADVAAFGVSAGVAADNGSQLAAAMGVLSDQASTADSKVSALQLSLKLMSEGGMEKANDEVAKFYQNLDTLGSSLSTDKGKILDANGALDLTSARGRDVQSTIETARDAMAAYAESAADGGQSTDVTTKKLQGLYEALEKQLLPAFGGNKQAVDALLTSMGLIPSNIATEYQSNAPDATSKANGVGGAIKKIPKSWFSTFSSNSGSFVNQAGHAAGAVRGIPTRWTTALRAVDGVTAVVNGAQAAIDGLRGRSVPITAYLTGVSNVTNAINSLLGSHHASGGPVTSGWTTINEEGQEAVHMPNGATVLPHANTSAMLGQQSSGSMNVSLEVAPGADTAVGTLLKSLVRTSQVVLVVNGKRVSVG